MKVVIFVGGFGSRLGRLTESVPKPMVPIGGLPMIHHVMGIFGRQGFREFVLCLGVKGDVIRQHFANLLAFRHDVTIDLGSGVRTPHEPRRAPDWKVTLAETGIHTLKGGRLKRVERYLDGASDHFLTYGDGLADVDLHELLAFHRSHQRLVTMTGVRPPGRFGEVELQDGQVVGFREKAQRGAPWINGGFMVFRRELLDRLSNDQDCDLEPTILRSLAQEGEVALFRHPGSWACLDTEADLQRLEQMWERGQAFWHQATAPSPATPEPLPSVAEAY